MLISASNKAYIPHIAELPSEALRYSISNSARATKRISFRYLIRYGNVTAPAGAVEVIVVVNAPDNAVKEVRDINQNTY